MRKHGEQVSDWTFPLPEEGWKLLLIEELELYDKKGKSSLRIGCVIGDDEEDEGKKINIFVPIADEKGKESSFGEQKIADIVEQVGLTAKFEKIFPGDISWFDQKVLDRLFLSLPNKRFMGFVERSEFEKEGKMVPSANIIKTKALGIKDDGRKKGGKKGRKGFKKEEKKIKEEEQEPEDDDNGNDDDW